MTRETAEARQSPQQGLYKRVNGKTTKNTAKVGKLSPMDQYMKATLKMVIKMALENT